MSYDLAKERLAICSTCPKNSTIPGFPNTFSARINHLKVDDDKLGVPRNSPIFGNYCKGLSTLLRVTAWIKADYFKAHLRPNNVARLHPNCWIRKYFPPPGQDFTVVITAFQRPDHLEKAFASCRAAGVQFIVVTATGDMQPMQAVFTKMRAEMPGIVIQEHGPEIGSNLSWKLGVDAAQTEYVAILHDDDLLLPNYSALVEDAIKTRPGFVLMQARNHGCHDYIDKDTGHNGLVNTDAIRPRLTTSGKLAISPVRGVFRRTNISRWLQICEELPEDFQLRPGFLVGNDLLIWLHAIDEYPVFYNVPRPGVSFGHWDGSTTVSEIRKPDTRLYQIYDRARLWYVARKRRQETPVIHFLTIVLDGMPFIAQHLAVFNRLKVSWVWHIVEGVSANTHCTSWCRKIEPRLSRDGTTEYLDSIANHPRVKIYRKPLWDGKVEMCNAPLKGITAPGILVQIDCDEFWTAQQLEDIVKLFNSDKTKTHAMFWCRYFFGPHLVMTQRNCYANNPGQDWKRAWRFNPGDTFLSHEPPRLSSEGVGFPHFDTECRNLIFDHYGYALRKQVEFKERFYGYAGAVEQWERLQKNVGIDAVLSDYLKWIDPKNSGKVHVI